MREHIGGKAVPGGGELPPADLAATITERAGRLPLYGRSRELARLRAALDAVAAGEFRVVALAGAAGIGKSRLLAEAAADMAGRGGLVASGRCVDEVGLPPYVPWLGALAELDDASPPVADRPRGDGPGRLADLLLEPRSRAGIGGPTPEQRRLRSFDAVARSLAAIARERPLLVALDDLQWSDAASNRLLRYVAGQLSSVPLAIVIAYRADEAATNPHLARTVLELDRLRRLTTVSVEPLGEPETAQLVAGLIGSPAPSLSRAVHRHSEGNPFFVEEVIRSLAADGDLALTGDATTAVADLTLPLPASIVAVIQRRLARVSAPGRETLECAALVGRSITVELLVVATGLDDERIADHLDEATRAALVRPLPASGAGATSVADFVFLHDRIREAIVAGINPVRRRALHLRLAVALEAANAAPDDLARLAALTHHWRQARHPDRAAAYAEHFGDAALRANAFDGAVHAYRLACDLCPTPDNEPALRLKLGDALLAAGSAEALDAYAAAERAFAAGGDRLGTARALHRLGVAHGRQEDHDAAVADLEAAARTLEQSAAGMGAADDWRLEMAGILVELGTVLGTSLARYDDAIAASRRALALSDEIGREPSLDASARLALGQALLRSGRLPEGKAILDTALPLAVAAANPDLAAEIAGALANHAYWTGDLDASERLARRRRELAIHAGDPYARRHALPWLALLAESRGDWEEAERLLDAAGADVERAGSPEPRAFLRHLAGMHALQRGQHASAVACLEEGVGLFRRGGPAVLVWYLGCLARAYLLAGETAAAELTAAETAAIVAALPAGSLPRAPALGQLGLLTTQMQDVPAMRRWYRELTPYAGQLHWVLIDRVRGALAGALGDRTAAERHFADAAAVAVRGSIRPELALIAAERTALRLDASPGERAECADHLRDAIQRLTALGMAGEAARFAALLSAREGVAPTYPSGLTAREVEILALLAQGLTNRQISERLSISPRTVANHLTHIFTKADLDNRGAAVAFALRHDLAR